MVVNDSENVGIGESNPLQKSSVGGNITASGSITSSSLNVNGGLSCQGAFCTTLSAGSSVSSSGSISCAGATFIGGNTWHHAMGIPVAYYEDSGRNYYRGGSSSDTSIPPHIWRNRDDVNRLLLLQVFLRISGEIEMMLIDFYYYKYSSSYLEK